MIRGIIFDMDGVLLDTEPFYHQRRRQFLIQHGMEEKSGINFTGSNERAIWETLVPGDPSLREELKQKYRQYQKEHPIPYQTLLDPEVTPLFTALKKRGLRLAIASSSAKSVIQKVMALSGTEHLVDYCISGEECAHHKPDPEIYRRALEGLGLTPKEAIAIEDSPAGIAAAKNADILVYALLPRQSAMALDQRAADGHLSSLLEIKQLLKQDK